MKKIYGIIVLLVSCLCLFSCSDDNDSNPRLEIPEDFVLNTPATAALVYDLELSKTVELTCMQPDYGFPAATIYRVQVALDEDFHESEILPTSYTTAKIDVVSKEIAMALVNLLGIENEEDYPRDPHPVYIRLSAELTNGMGKTLSNIIELEKVKGYFALEDMELPENMYLIGNVAGNWKWDKATKMVPVGGNPGMFWCMQYLGQTEGTDNPENAEIKFNSVNDWVGGDFGMEANIDAASKTLAGIGDETGGNIKIGNPGWYIVVVKVELEGREYVNSVQFHEPYVYLSGDVNGGAWGNSDPQYRFTIPELSKGADTEFVSPAFTQASGEGGVRASIILDGAEWWQTEFIVLDGKLEYRGDGGDQDRVSGAVGQRLYLNFTKNTGRIE